MEIDKFLNEAETIYKLVLARQLDIDLAVYMAQRLEQRSKIAAQYLIFLCLIKPQFKRAFLINGFIETRRAFRQAVLRCPGAEKGATLKTPNDPTGYVHTCKRSCKRFSTFPATQRVRSWPRVKSESKLTKAKSTSDIKL